jgi:hypothetical protein
MLAASGSGIDAFSYHHYGATSQRCSGMPGQTTPEAALSEEWLARTDQTRAFYQTLRDEFEPGKPMWVTETADAACGGNPWASTFLDTFRYSINLAGLPRPACRWLRTTRSPQAIKACLKSRRCGRAQTIGRRCFGAGLWVQPFSTPAPTMGRTSMRIAGEVYPEPSHYQPSIRIGQPPPSCDCP